MQLDPNAAFASQIRPLFGNDFENIVASCYFYLGYNIQRNLTVRVSNQSAAEIDVYASMITPLVENIIAIECKGATPRFNDLRKFSTVRQILAHDNIKVNLAAYGADSSREEHQTFAKILQINLMKKEDLSKKILPILWQRGTFVLDRIKIINRYLAIFTIKDHYYNHVYGSIEDPDVKKMIGSYIRFLKSEVWSVSNPIDQLNLCFEKSKTDFLGFTETIANKLGTTASSEVSNPSNEIVQLAMLLQLEHRIMNLYAITRASILARTETGRTTISERTPSIRSALNLLCDHNVTISQFPNFAFRYFYLRGGVILKQGEIGRLEKTHFANECGLSIDVLESFLEILRTIYRTGNNLFFENNDKEFFKYVPSAFRALGVLHRRSIDQKYNGISFFHEDASNFTQLDNSLVSLGGSSGLRFE